MRNYLVSGFFTYGGGAVRPMAGTATLEDDEVLDLATAVRIEQILLAENNRTGTIATSMRITSFQPYETLPAPLAAPTAEEVQLNECAVILPPVDSPILVEIAPGVLLRALRPVHAENRGDQLLFNLQNGGQFIGRPRWTHP